ncbi:MAG: hypothetical protein KF838_04160 [Phycisphaeraceae bacterium]|nr:MAG: hypothetical protein KF838_04160 [Phycisphaeraceae bacterium]
MRVPIKHLHRAFPELDGYTDEQCARFVRAARGSTRRDRLVRSLVLFLIIGLINVACFAFVVMLLGLSIGKNGGRLPGFGPGPRQSIAEAIAMVALLVVLVGVGPILGYLARDFLIMDRIRWILRSRGLCAKCGYSLVGLGVSAENLVTCPECGSVNTVDPSLSELQIDDAGHTRFRPEIASGVRPPLLIRMPGWCKSLARSLLRIAAGGLVIMLVACIVYEIFLRVQAREATRHFLTQEAIQRLVLEAQPAGMSADEPDALESGRALAALVREIGERVGEEPDFKRDRALMPGYWYVGMSDEQIADSSSIDDVALLERDLALRCIEELHRTDFRDVARQLCDRRRVAYTIEDTDGSVADHPWPAEPHFLWHVVYVFSADAHLARQSGDTDRFAAAIEAMLAIARIYSLHPGFSTWFRRPAIDLMVFDLLIDAFNDRFVDGLLAVALRDAIERQQSEVRYEWNYEILLKVTEDQTARLFADPSAVRLGPFSSSIRDIKERFAQRGGVASGRVGTLASNLREIEEIRGATAAAFAADPVHAPGIASAVAHPAHLVPVVNLYRMDRLLLDRLHRDLLFDGLRVMLALELFRDGNGTYPDALDELTPMYIERLPLDPFDGRPLKYLRIDPTLDGAGRAYLLYSVGADGQDDFGSTYTDPRSIQTLLWLPTRDDAIGMDVVVNQRRQKR